jgi:NAD(P)-dependent dehydrogenase (short-subunit alcohol dehydrogenase family)
MPDAAATPLLAGRFAVVTGAARGIGSAIAAGFARQGADLALCDRDGEGLAAVARAVEAAGRRAHTGVFDLREEAALEDFFASLAQRAPRIDALVCNAGGTFQAPFLELPARGREALVRENFTQAAECVRLAAPSMGEGGSIVFVSSIEAHRAAPGYAVYAAMKAALESLARSLALELGPRGIRVNCIAPDAIPTPGVGAELPPTPLARRGHPDDVAGAALFLASPLSAFVTGTTLFVDGGNRAAGGWRHRADGGWET